MNCPLDGEAYEMNNSYRVLLAPTEIAGQYRNLTIALRQIGVNADYYSFYQHKSNYGDDIGSSKIPGYMRNINAKGKTGGVIIRFISIVVFEILRFIFFLKYFYKYDVFIFGFGLSLLRFNLDLAILKLFKKRIIANLSHGSEMTPDYLNGALLDENYNMPPIKHLIRNTFHKKKLVKKFEAYADFIIGSPLSSSFLSSKHYIDIIKIGRTCQAQTSEVRSTFYKSDVKILNLVHIPSHAPGKGTLKIRCIMEKIISEYPNVRYHEITNVSNSDVLKKLPSYDLLIDQLYSDLPLSGVGMESFVCGVPVLIAGYGLLDLKEIYDKNIFPPVIICHPDELYTQIINIIKSKEDLFTHSIGAKKFVENHWSLEHVARRYEILINGVDIPDDWFHDPRNFHYFHGYGLDEEICKKNINNIVNDFGIDSLGLNNRSDLLRKLIAFASK